MKTLAIVLSVFAASFMATADDPDAFYDYDSPGRLFVEVGQQGSGQRLICCCIKVWDNPNLPNTSECASFEGSPFTSCSDIDGTLFTHPSGPFAGETGEFTQCF